VVEELLVAGAQVVEPGFPVRGHGEAVLRALPPTSEAHVAVPAAAGQGVALLFAEAALCLRADELDQVGVGDVAEEVLGGNEVVAGVGPVLPKLSPAAR
jgi:hypothetical protein